MLSREIQDHCSDTSTLMYTSPSMMTNILWLVNQLSLGLPQGSTPTVQAWALNHVQATRPTHS